MDGTLEPVQFRRVLEWEESRTKPHRYDTRTERRVVLIDTLNVTGYVLLLHPEEQVYRPFFSKKESRYPIETES